MIQVNFNKPRSATQDELELLFCYELERRYTEYTYPDHTEVHFEESMKDAYFAVWESNEKDSEKIMVVVWGCVLDGISLYRWTNGLIRYERGLQIDVPI